MVHGKNRKKRVYIRIDVFIGKKSAALNILLQWIPVSLVSF